MEHISGLVQQHKDTLVPGQPQLNVCDQAVMVSALGNPWSQRHFGKVSEHVSVGKGWMHSHLLVVSLLRDRADPSSPL